MSLFKRSLDNITLPDDAKASVRAGIENSSQQEKVRRVSIKRALPALIAAALVIALCVSLLPAMLGRNRPITNVDTTSGDWISQLFSPADAPNKSGENKDPLSSVGWSSIGEMFEVAGMDAAPSVKDDMETAPPTAEIGSPADDPTGTPAHVDTDADNNIRPSAGTLTAGRVNDNAAFGSFVAAMQKLESVLSARMLNPAKRITVTVPDVFNAMVALTDEQGNVLSTARTDIHGVAYLYYDLRGGNSVPHTVGVSKNGSYAQQTVEPGVDSVTIDLVSQVEESVKLDLMIMLDTTGSMGDELAYIKAELNDMIHRIAEEGKTADIRLSVNFYRDHGDEYTVKYYEFTSDIDKCIEYISAQHADGGGDAPEAVDEALINGVCGHAWRDDAAKVMFMVLDAPAHAESERQGTNQNIARAITTAANMGVRIIPIVASGADDDLEATMRTAAAVTGGRYLFLTDHSGIGGSHKDPVDVQSGIFPLNDLMVDTVLEYIKK